MNQSDEISEVIKDMDLDALVITETCLTCNVSYQIIVGKVTPAEYSSDSQEKCGSRNSS